MPFDSTQFEFLSPQEAKAPSPPANPVVEVLRKARARIAVSWFAGADRQELWVRHPVHQVWCASNTISHVGPATRAIGDAARKCLWESLPTPGSGLRDIYHFNDNIASHTDIVALFDRAIAKAEQV